MYDGGVRCAPGLQQGGDLVFRSGIVAASGSGAGHALLHVDDDQCGMVGMHVGSLGGMAGAPGACLGKSCCSDCRRGANLASHGLPLVLDEQRRQHADHAHADHVIGGAQHVVFQHQGHDHGRQAAENCV